MHSRLPDGRVAVVLCAHDDALVAQDARAVADYLDRHPCSVGQVAAHLLTTRRTRRHRTVVRARDRAELAAGLDAVAGGREHPLVARSDERATGRTAFVFPGQGSQWPAMGAQLHRLSPVYRAEVDRCGDAFVAAGVASPLVYLTTEYAEAGMFSEIEAQAAQFAHAVGLAAVWRSCGILPDLTLGHSLGEVGAAYVAGAISLPDAVGVVIARASVVDSLPGEFGMAVLGVSAQHAAELIAATTGWLELSAVNASESVVVSGERAAVLTVVAGLEARGRFARALAVDYPGHTSALEPLRDELVRLLPVATFADTPIQCIGSATGAAVPAGTDFHSYWYANLRNTVRFDQAADAAIARNAGTFIELSAHPALLLSVEDALDRARATAVLTGSGRRDAAPVDELSAMITAVALTEPGFRWLDLLAGSADPLFGFPNAPMRAEHLWALPEPLPPRPRLIVTVESWQQAGPVARAAAPRTVAVLGLADAQDLATQIGAVIEVDAGAQSATTAEAAILVVVSPALDGAVSAGAAGQLAALIDAGLLDYTEAIGRRCRDVWLVTAGAEQVRPSDPPPVPGPAALAALHRSIGFEHPDQTFHHADLTARRPGDGELRALVETLLTRSGEIAIRADGADVVKRTLGDDVSDAPEWDLTTGVLDDVVITGGSGAIGLSYARYLAASGARRIVLLSRRGVEPSVLEDLRGGHGTEIIAPACDITDTDQVSAAAMEFGGSGATLVIHAAGTAQFADRAAITGAALIGMSAAKLRGLAQLNDVWPIRRDARMLLCSSVTGVWGGKGVGAYGAANRLLDAMAAGLRAAGRDCVSVRWGLWAGSDIVDAAEIARTERAGLRQMDPALAVPAGLRDHRADPLVLAADPDRLQVFFGTAQRDETGPDARAAGTTEPMSPADAVRAHLAGVLKADAATLDLDSSLFDLGVDSLLALDLRKRLKKSTGRTVALATLLAGITGTDLIADLTAGTTPQKVDSSRD